MTTTPTADLAIIIVSTNEAHWLEACLSTVYAHAGDIELDVVVVNNESTDGTRELVEECFPAARVVDSRNNGFAHANNRGAMTCDARYVLFLNPDTEVVDGTFAELVAALDARPDVGLAGVRQITADGALWPTIRYFPSVRRAIADAVGVERWPSWRSDLGERELDLNRYDHEVECDWTSGSFMFARREALLSAGMLDERFFIYSEEPDLCLRLRRDGWRIRHLPSMTIVHHAGKGGVRPRMVAQDAYTRRQYAQKHFSPPRRVAYLGAVLGRHAIRAAVPSRAGGQRQEAAKLAMKTLLGRAAPPFGAPAATAMRVRDDAAVPGRAAHRS